MPSDLGLELSANIMIRPNAFFRSSTSRRRNQDLQGKFTSVDS